MAVEMRAAGKVLQATFLDNATASALVARFPPTVPMMDLYGQMCFRFPEALPAGEARRSGYEVGGIACRTPGHSLVIFHAQNGEITGNLQKAGHTASGVGLFSRTGDATVIFVLPQR